MVTVVSPAVALIAEHPVALVGVGILVLAIGVAALVLIPVAADDDLTVSPW